MLYLAVKKIDWNETPLEVFEKIRSKDAFLMQSGRNGQYSFVGWHPFLKIEGRDDVTIVSHRKNEDWNSLEVKDDPLKVLQETLNQFKLADSGNFNFPFLGGACGFLSYDYGVKMAGIKQKANDELFVPDLYFIFLNRFVVWDHHNCDTWLVCLNSSPLGCEDDLDRIMDDFWKEKNAVNDFVGTFDKPDKQKVAVPKSNITKDIYCQKIDKIKDFLTRGETYEVNFAHRYKCEVKIDPWEMYKKITQMNPSPFACYFEHPDFQIVSCSPERLVVCRDGILETRPIKGTVPRGQTPEEDKMYEQQLLSSEKDQAELNMIVDLARNDLGKVCEIGSVEVTEHRVIEKYSHVQHTMSNIRGKKMKDVNFAEVVKALFPGGSITGAPKKRTMEIIDELEDVKRGFYCGSAGYISFDGNFDLNIMIRTVTCKNGEGFFHSGGAIVIDSEPEDEWQETIDKAQVLIQACS